MADDTFATVDASVVEKLRKYDTPTVCNVLELFDVWPRTAGYFDRRITSCFPGLPPMVGYAATATFLAGSPPRGGDVYGGLSDQVAMIAEMPGPAVVVFQDLDDPMVAATFGEVMCTTYKAFGCAGLISSGAGRDLDQVAALKFPCFTGGTIASHGYCQIVSLGVPVRVGGVTVHKGDLMHGDCNGVTLIPTEVASELADACQEFMDAESIVLDYLKGGSVTPAGFDEARKGCSAKIGELAKRLRRG